MTRPQPVHYILATYVHLEILGILSKLYNRDPSTYWLIKKMGKNIYIIQLHLIVVSTQLKPVFCIQYCCFAVLLGRQAKHFKSHCMLSKHWKQIVMLAVSLTLSVRRKCLKLL